MQTNSASKIYYLDSQSRASSNAASKGKGKSTKKRAGTRKFDLNGLKNIKSNYDVTLIAVIFILVFFGLVMVFSASAPTALAYKNNEYHFILRQSICAVLGFIAVILSSLGDKDPKKESKKSKKEESEQDAE